MRHVRIPALLGTAVVASAALALGGTALATSGSGSAGDSNGDSGSSQSQSGNNDSSSSQSQSGNDNSSSRQPKSRDARSDRARREIRRSGRCSGSSRWKFKVKNEDNNRLEVEFEVDQNRNGQRWGVALKQNGRFILRRAYRTRAPSGSFEARKITRNRSGRDRLVAVARHPRTGERCTARITF